MALEFNLNGKPGSFGHHFVVGLSGTELTDANKRLLAALKPAGIILYRRNFAHDKPYEEWFAAVARLVAEARNYAERDRMIVSIDHEGGKVVRPPAPITSFPAPRHYAGKAGTVARAMGRELKSLGVNVCWAPLADIDTNPCNPVIGQRSFGTTAEEVSESACMFVKNMQAEGVLPCGKHFPGHGDTSCDSHLELPTLDLSSEDLRRRELVPFAALVDAGVPLMMTAHILFPAIDAQPATLSRQIMQGILRDELGFSGVLVTDDLGMLAVAQAVRAREAAARMISSSCDLCIAGAYKDPEHDESALELAKNIYYGLEQRLITEDELYNSYLRIELLFEKQLKDHTPKKLPADVFEQHRRLAEDLQR